MTNRAAFKIAGASPGFECISKFRATPLVTPHGVRGEGVRIPAHHVLEGVMHGLLLGYAHVGESPKAEGVDYEPHLGDHGTRVAGEVLAGG